MILQRGPGDSNSSKRYCKPGYFRLSDVGHNEIPLVSIYQMISPFYLITSQSLRYLDHKTTYLDLEEKGIFLTDYVMDNIHHQEWKMKGIR